MGNFLSPDKAKSPTAGGVLGQMDVLGGMYAAAGGIIGGGKRQAGLDLVKDYADSIYSKTKKDLIIKLADAAAKALQMKRSFSGVDDAVKFLQQHVPNPRKGDTVKANTAIHRKVCQDLAGALNAAYGVKLVTVDNNERVCNEVAELVNSLIGGLHVEFASVAADVSQTSDNLVVLLEFLKQNHAKYLEIIQASNDEEIKANATIVNNFYGKLVEEVDRQLAVLNNIVGNVLKPVSKDMIELVQKSDSFKGMVENIKNELGTKEFGDKLGYVLSGVSDAAEAAKIVDKALKEVGMSVAEYRNTRGVEELRDAIFGALSKSGKQLGGDELVKFVRAADILYRYDFRQPQIIKALEDGGRKGGVDPTPADEKPATDEKPDGEIVVEGGGCGCEGADGGATFGVRGGADGEKADDLFERKYNAKDSLAQKQKDLTRFQDDLFVDFEKSLLTHYRNVVGIISQIGPKLGNDIPIDENVREFVRHFSSMENTNRNNIAKALSGYNKSGASLANRNRFIADFAKLLVLAAPLASRSPLFKSLEGEIKEMNELIDVFGEKFVKAIQSPMNPRVAKPFAKGGDDVNGGDVDGGDFVPSNISTASAEKYASFQKAKLQLSYYMAIANIKRSMARAATDDIGSDEAYKTMMGQSVAQMINAEAKTLEATLKAADTAIANAIADPDKKASAEKVKDLAKKQFTAKKELLECAQNIDLYLRAFTADAVAKPEDLIKLSGVLEQFVNVRKFYTHGVGNNLAALFDMFDGGSYNPADDYVGKYLTTAGMKLGEHRNPLNYKQADEFVKKLDNVVFGIRALENVLLAFAQIGNEQTDKTFMSHGKVLNVLSNYIAASAYSIEGIDGDETPSEWVTKHKVDTQKLSLCLGMHELDVTDSKLTNTFEETNKVFVYILKAICGKILTVLGLYSIYNHPNSNYMSVSAVRTILGGGADKPTIIPEALEMYIRIPLLIEWLRASFVSPTTGSTALAAQSNYSIAMIPDVTSPWSELLKIFLIRTNHVTDGNYTESDVYAIVNEINKVYAAYREKSPSDTTYAAMEGLIKDFNSRYGIMKTADVKTYMDKYRNAQDYDDLKDSGRDEDFVNFDLLDSKNARSSGVAPSERFVAASTAATLSKSEWTTESLKLVQRLHYNLAKQFRDQYTALIDTTGTKRNVVNDVTVTASINGVVDQYRYELAAASSNEEKVKIVMKAIQTVGMYSDHNPNKFFMFHEMVVGPLYSLYRTYQIVRQFVEAYSLLSSGVMFTAVDATHNLIGATKIQKQIISAIQRTSDDEENDKDGNPLTFGSKEVSLRKLLRFQLSLLTVMKTTFGDLVSVNLAGSAGVRYPVVDLNNLKDYIGVVLENVKKALSSMRSFMPPTFIAEFENVNVDGSVFWLESHMMNQLFGNDTKAENSVNIRELNKYVGEVFKKTLVALGHPTNKGMSFEAAYDLCFWRMKNGKSVRVNAVGQKESSFPNNVIELIDDMNPSAGTVDKMYREKLFSAASTGYPKLVAAIAREKTLNGDDATPGIVSMLTGKLTQGKAPSPDINSLADISEKSLFLETDLTLVNPVIFKSKLIKLKQLMNDFDNKNNDVFKKVVGPNPFDYADINGSSFGDAALTDYTDALKNYNNTTYIPGQMLAHPYIKNLAAADSKAGERVNMIMIEAFILSLLKPDNSVDAARIIHNYFMYGDTTELKSVKTSTKVYTDVSKKAHDAAQADYDAKVANEKKVKNDVDAKQKAVNDAQNAVDADTQAKKDAAAAAGAAPAAPDPGLANALTAAQRDLVAAQTTLATAQRDLAAAQIALTTAQDALDLIKIDDIIIQCVDIGHPLVNNITKYNPKAVDANLEADFKKCKLDTKMINVVLNNLKARADGQFLTNIIENATSALPLSSSPSNCNEDISAAFVVNHPDFVQAYQDIRKVIQTYTSYGPTQRMGLVRNGADALVAGVLEKEMEEYLKLVKGEITDANGKGISFIFNTMAMNTGWDNNSTIDNYGIVPMFNRTLQQYMDTFFDKLSSKFYGPLIEEFATGHFSPAIVNKKAYNDTNVINKSIEDTVGLVPPGIVLASSNARGIRIILNKRDDKGVAKLYALNSLADVSPQMKETMRANLPAFRSAFRDLYDQAEILKRLMMNTNIKDGLKYNKNVLTSKSLVTHRDSSSTPYLDRTSSHDELNHNYFKQALEQVQLGCEVLVKLSNQVYKELNDAPLFGESYNGSLAEFKQKTSRYPITPLSTAQLFVKGTLLPGTKSGDEFFKIVYGLRGLADFQVSKAPGYEELLRLYNVTVPESAKMNPKYFEEYTMTYVPLLRYLIKLNGPVRLFNNSSTILGDLLNHSEIKTNEILPAGNPNSNIKIQSFIVDVTLEDLTSLITNTDVEYEHQRFIDLYANQPPAAPKSGASQDNRTQIQYRNLIETGIVPVNVNALQREIPLVNLLNYAATFEKSVIDALGVELSKKPDQIVDSTYPTSKSTKEIMAHSLVHPYGTILNAEFNDITSYCKVIVGDGLIEGRLRFARPKFISDQIWGKLCVRDMVKPDNLNPDIKYITKEGAVSSAVTIKDGQKNRMGKRRFDTVLVRNLVWTVQLHRFLTWNIKEQSRKVVNAVAQGSDAYDPAAVEFYGTEGVESYPL